MLQLTDKRSSPPVSQDTLPSLLPIASLSKYYYSGLVTRCSTSDVYGTGVDTTVDAAVSTVVSIVFSNTVRFGLNAVKDRHRMTPTSVLRHGLVAVLPTEL